MGDRGAVTPSAGHLYQDGFQLRPRYCFAISVLVLYLEKPLAFRIFVWAVEMDDFTSEGCELTIFCFRKEGFDICSARGMWAAACPAAFAKIFWEGAAPQLGGKALVGEAWQNTRVAHAARRPRNVCGKAFVAGGSPVVPPGQCGLSKPARL